MFSNKHMCKLLTIVVTYNGMEWIGKCLRSLESSSVPTDVYVIDNGSTDGTQEYVQSNFPSVIFFQSAANLGFGRGNNIGLQYALDEGYEYVYLLNQDAWVLPDTFEQLITVSEKNPEYGILSPMQMSPDLSRFESFFDELVISKNGSKLYRDWYMHEEKSVYPVKFVQAAHWLITRKCLTTIGGFSPTFPHYSEDDNYCERVLYHGMKIGIVPAAKSVHDADKKPPKTKKKFHYRVYVGFLHDMSNILDPSQGAVLSLIKKTLKEIKLYKSFYPIIGILKALKSINKIHINKVLTKGYCAFLNK